MAQQSINLKFVISALQVRLRFFLVVAALAALFAIWPWLDAIWEKMTSRWTRSDTESAVSSGSEYFCPMDPGVVSAWPAICPVCNMDLIRRAKTDAHVLPDGALARMQVSPYKLTLAGIRTVGAEAVESTESQVTPGDPLSETAQSIRVPASAIVYWDRQPLVYVESMPCMFDAVAVTLQQRQGDSQIVTGKLVPGQAIAAVGTLLLDAEVRLRPNLSTQYFGAARQSALTSLPPDLPKKVEADRGGTTVSKEDQLIIDQQQVCPVTEQKLGSMGTPVFVDLKGRKVALCCAGCRGRIQANPDKYLQWLDQRATRTAADGK